MAVRSPDVAYQLLFAVCLPSISPLPPLPSSELDRMLSPRQFLTESSPKSMCDYMYMYNTPSNIQP